MSDVELLREAATRMRERADWASPGPWETNGDDGLVWANRLGDPVCAPGDMADSRHIASWDPTVALAVADWLDYSATWVEDLTPHAEHERDRRAGHALKVARAYLRSGS